MTYRPTLQVIEWHARDLKTERNESSQEKEREELNAQKVEIFPLTYANEHGAMIQGYPSCVWMGRGSYDQKTDRQI